MDDSRDHYAQWNKSDRERQIPYDLTLYVESKTQNKKSQNENRLTDTENKWVVARGERDVGIGKLRGTDLQLQNRCAMGMECTAWGI